MRVSKNEGEGGSLLRAAARLSLIIAAFGMLITAPKPAEAGRSGRIYLLKKRPPPRLRSIGGFLRKYHTTKIWPDKRNKKEWRFEFMAFFKRKHNDLEVKVRFYDITSGKKFIAGDSIFLAKRGQKILASDMVLEKPRFQPNRKYLMYIVTARKVLLAQTKFWLRGKTETYSGRVTFSEKEAR
jgi:hypothetical protein